MALPASGSCPSFNFCKALFALVSTCRLLDGEVMAVCSDDVGGPRGLIIAGSRWTAYGPAATLEARGPLRLAKGHKMVHHRSTRTKHGTKFDAKTPFNTLK